MKKCSNCKVEKEVTDFSKDKLRKDGFQSKCKTCDKDLIKKWRENNKERREKYRKEWYKSNLEYNKIKNKEWRKKNKEHIKEYNKSNKDRKNKLRREKSKLNPLFRLTSNLRNRTCYAFRNKGYTKNSKTKEILGVEWEFCKVYIEIQFTKGMTWVNYGDWHIDHIIPLASAKTEEELKKLCHYSNLQPLWAVDNLIKSDKISGQQNKFRF
tara:strand:- start:119 stop:751 length:633 start_codon:yes stop_codon:yes gene_type:complete